MKRATIAIIALLVAAPASAQFGKLGEIQRRANQAKKVADLHISDEEERRIGEAASARVRAEYGVLQDAALTKYVSLVGNVLAKASKRPDLKWEFIVLDTEGVNAFAAPGGLVHVTKGALGLMRSEAELAGVLGHEIAHITEKHSVESIRGSGVADLVNEEVGRNNYWYGRAGDFLYDNILDKGWSRGQENESDEEGARLANKVGYDPNGLGTFLQKLIDRNKNNKGGNGPNGLFSTHPDTRDRIARLNRQIKTEKLASTATGADRYAANVKFTAKEIAELKVADPDARGLTGGSTAKKDEPKKEEPKKSGGLFGGVGSRLSGGSQKESQQASASGGARGVGREDRYAVGGSNPNKLNVTIPAAELEAFRKGIA